MLKNVRRDRSPDKVMVTNEMKVDRWLAQKHVFEVRDPEIAQSPMHTSNLTEEEIRGLALRFPRFGRWKPEKTPKRQPLYKRLQTCFLPRTR
jgi:DNA ligase-1